MMRHLMRRGFDTTFHEHGIDHELDWYLAKATKTRHLPIEEEQALFVALRNGDESARDKIIEHNLLFVVASAKKFPKLGVELPDLIQAGNVGLVRATETFDHTRGNRFISYATWWIYQSILLCIGDTGKCVRIPPNAIKYLLAVSRAMAAGHRDIDAIMAATGISRDRVESVFPWAMRTLSIDYVAPDAQADRPIIDTLTTGDPGDDIERTSRREFIDRLLAELPDRESMVLRDVFGLDDGESKTLDYSGGKLGVSRERARQLKNIALNKLRKRAKKLGLVTCDV